MCIVLNLPIVSVYTSRLIDGSFQGYINVGIPPACASSWTSAVSKLFHGAPMLTEYAAIDGAADNIIQFHCTHKNVCTEWMCTATVTYHQAILEQALWFRYEDLLGKIEYICIKLAGLLSINHRSAVRCTPKGRGQFSDLSKLANSQTRLLGHKRDTERALLKQVNHC
jgi:hypothetical protein